jgi:hypothetical protein
MFCPLPRLHHETGSHKNKGAFHAMGLDVVDIWNKPRHSKVMSLIKGKGMESYPHLATFP